MELKQITCRVGDNDKIDIIDSSHNNNVVLCCDPAVDYPRESGIAKIAFICKAVNCHKELLEACRQAKKDVYEAINKRPVDLSLTWTDLDRAIAKAGAK